MQSLENNQKTPQNRISLQTTWCCSGKHYSQTRFGSVDFHQSELVETCSRSMCSINQNARLREKIYTRHKNYLSRRNLYLTLVRSKLCYSSQVWVPQSVELIKRVERIQRRASKFILDLPFICDVGYSVRLEHLHPIPLCYWHEFLDLVFYLKCINGIINIHDDVLPPVLNEDRATRPTNPDCLTFITPKCRTATFQKSFMSRCARVWNVLPNELTAKNISIACFKSRLYKYYESALKIYNVENPRTWKSICLSCNMSRNLFCSNSCCY